MAVTAEQIRAAEADYSESLHNPTARAARAHLARLKEQAEREAAARTRRAKAAEELAAKLPAAVADLEAAEDLAIEALRTAGEAATAAYEAIAARNAKVADIYRAMDEKGLNHIDNLGEHEIGAGRGGVIHIGGDRQFGPASERLAIARLTGLVAHGIWGPHDSTAKLVQQTEPHAWRLGRLVEALPKLLWPKRRDVVHAAPAPRATVAYFDPDTKAAMVRDGYAEPVTLAAWEAARAAQRRREAAEQVPSLPDEPVWAGDFDDELYRVKP